MSAHRADWPRRGFTLVELITVVGLIGVLIGLLLPAVLRVREAANRAVCTNNLRQIGSAVMHYHEMWGHLPPSRDARFGHKEGASWSWLILPQLGEENLYRKWSYLVPWEDLSPKQRQSVIEAFATPVSIYFCPSRRGPSVATFGTNQFPSNDIIQKALGDYAGCAGRSGDDLCVMPRGWGLPIPPHGAFQHAALNPDIYKYYNVPKKVRHMDITDGLSQTLLVGEKYIPEHGRSDHEAIYDGWNDPPPLVAKSARCAGAFPFFAPILPPQGRPPLLLSGFGSEHPGICQFVFCDGRVQALNVDTHPVVLGWLAQRNDGMSVNESSYEP